MVTHRGTESVHLLLVTRLINNATLTVFTQQALLLQYASLSTAFYQWVFYSLSHPLLSVFLVCG